MMTFLLILSGFENTHAQTKGAIDLFVDKKLTGGFQTIQAAINSLPDSSDHVRVIHIAPGVYEEKLFITKHNIALCGVPGDNRAVKITQDIARDEWRCDHADDWGVATVNVNGNDITLRDLTISNEYGFHHREVRTVSCAADTVTHTKQVSGDGHQMALRTMVATRLRAINCRFLAWAGDTVSPWNTNDGMFYFKNCSMAGGVDFYCPRGWAWAEDCSFYANTGPASIWHDGSNNPDFKTVLKNCSFDGYEGFKLGRYHREAQFFLVDCKFSKAMADTDIYFVPGNTLKWGRRIYYTGCHRDGGDYAWFRDNLGQAKDQPSAEQITVDWLFHDKWHPEKN